MVGLLSPFDFVAGQARPGGQQQGALSEMKPEQIEQLRQQLLGLRSELQALERVSQQDTAPVELDQARVGRLSRMDAMQAQEMSQETARRRQRRLVEIAGALRRVESGDFGLCFVCGEEIGVRRLEADPTSTRCIRCAAGPSGS
jgi:DnaK suppressor protein